MKKLKPLQEYIDENGVKITVYPEKQKKRTPWQKNDTFYAAKLRITDDSSFARFTRKKGKA